MMEKAQQQIYFSFARQSTVGSDFYENQVGLATDKTNIPRRQSGAHFQVTKPTF